MSLWAHSLLPHQGKYLHQDENNIKLPPGEHGFHTHAVGKCEPPFESAGDHFNPDTKQHGYLDSKGQHAGDLPNVHVPESGTLKIDILASQLGLKDGQNHLLDKDGAALWC